MNDDATGATGQRSGRMMVLAIVVAVAAIVAYFALGMPGMDHGPAGGTMEDMEHGSQAVSGSILGV